MNQNHELNVKRIMIDCAPAEIAAIRQEMPHVQILLCHWHIVRAWDSHILSDVKHPGGTKDRVLERKNVRTMLFKIMHNNI